jgi:hypothetical protein
MTYTVRADGIVVREADNAFIPPDPTNADYAIFLDWVHAGNVPTQAAGPSVAQLVQQLTDAVQAIMDAKARSYGYDDLTTAVTYADEPAVAKFQTEGQAFRSWRSNVWATAYALLADVQAGTKPMPTAADIPALLPPFPLDT